MQIAGEEIEPFHVTDSIGLRPLEIRYLQTSETLAHEVAHANDARTNPERYSHERTTDAKGKVIPHDSCPVEQRAINGARQSQREVNSFKKENKTATQAALP
ncbi:MAG: hypothetical protein EBY17_27060 [Acidobacteriia bacterium]|nr:hypothetical protein [Terriglobia bacterium]